MSASVRGAHVKEIVNMYMDVARKDELLWIRRQNKAFLSTILDCSYSFLTNLENLTDQVASLSRLVCSLSC